MKRDVKRFPRVHTVEAGNRKRTLELLTPFWENSWIVDTKAFAKLMVYLKEFDRQHSTVLMVQSRIRRLIMEGHLWHGRQS